MVLQGKYYCYKLRVSSLEEPGFIGFLSFVWFISFIRNAISAADCARGHRNSPQNKEAAGNFWLTSLRRLSNLTIPHKGNNVIDLKVFR